MTGALLALIAVLASPIEHPERLSRFAADLHKSREKLIRVAHFGDSHIAADQLTSTLRDSFQARFGDGGRGFVLAGKPWRSYWPLGAVAGFEGPWVADGLRGGGLDDGLFGPGGCSMRTTSTQASISLTPKRPTSHVRVHYLRQPSGGCFEVRLAGKSIERVSSLGPWITADSWRHSFSAPSKQPVTVHHVGGGETRLLGLSMLNNAGITWEALGINGAHASRLLEGNAWAFSTWLKALNPRLVVLSYGTNELFDDHLDPKLYAQGLDAVLKRVRRAHPDADCLLTGPPDFLKRGKPVALTPTVYDVQRSLSDAHGCAFWDTQAAMGGPGVIADWRRQKWARRDNVHLTRDGYESLGTLLFEALLHATQQGHP